jgi:hypothetical protein
MRRGAGKDMANAIKHYQTSISLTPEGHLQFSTMLSNLANCFDSIFSRTGNVGHLEESIALH